MSTITVRLFHHPSRTPIAELQGVDPGATLSSLRALAERHLAAEEACMMRVFARWHIEVQLGARKAVVELTAQDEAASLSSLGIEDYSAVLLEGPLTGDFEGVGQGLALVAAQVREQNAEMKGILLQVVAGISELVSGHRIMFGLKLAKEHIKAFPNIEDDARFVLTELEHRAFGLFSLQKAAVVGCLAVVEEEAKVWGKLLTAERSDYQRFLPRFAIDPTTPPGDVCVVDPHTAVKKTDNSWVTLRASQPLSAAKHRWAVKIHKQGKDMSIRLGLLPKLSANMEAKMGSDYINDLGGWCITQNRSGSYVQGDWQCEELPFAKGDLVLFDYSFADKTLTIRCGGKQVVGRIPNAGEELYPAFTLCYTDEMASFEKYQ